MQKQNLNEEQIKIRALGEEMNQRARDSFKPREPSAQGIIDALSNLTKQQEDFILLREND